MGRLVPTSETALQTAPMAIGLFIAVSALVGLCAKHVTRKLGFRSKEKIADESGAKEGFGAGGLWQKEILMGEKCQPLDFSGAIYYDADGKRLAHLPLRTPRGRPLQSSIASSVALRELNRGT